MGEHSNTLRPITKGRKGAFVLLASDHGSMIVNRLDFLMDRPGYAVGVGCEMLEHCAYEAKEVDLAVGLLMLRREYNGPGVIAIDGGANVGVHTIEWARALHGHGQVIAFEPQERIFYALAGNIVLNNCHNAVALQIGLSAEDGIMEVPVLDYTKPGSYGGFEMKPPPLGGMISTGQASTGETAPVRTMRLDSLAIPRVDLIKLDLEGMELEALLGGEGLIDEHRPVLIVEHIKSGMDNILAWAKARDYEAFQFAGNIVCAHRLDKCLDHIRHLHRTLLRLEAGCANFDVEWLKFSTAPPETPNANG